MYFTSNVFVSSFSGGLGKGLNGLAVTPELLKQLLPSKLWQRLLGRQG